MVSKPIILVKKNHCTNVFMNLDQKANKRTVQMKLELFSGDVRCLYTQ